MRNKIGKEKALIEEQKVKVESEIDNLKQNIK